MPMIDIQRRHAEVFRIRLGDRDNGRPRKLTEQIRITARSKEIVEAFTAIYGGEVSPWENQFQAYLPTTELRILILPGQSIQQWWEFYRGSICERRCDGYQEQKSGNRCMCPEDIYARAEDRKSCSPMTRVNVLCPDVAVVGAGGLVTHSMIAAETLPQSVAVAEAALSRGLMVPAILRVVFNDKGRNHFIYPQIEIVGVSTNTLRSGEINGELPHATQTPTAEIESRARLTPVPASLPSGPVSSVAQQVDAVDEDRPRSARRNAAQPIPPTGLQPRTAAQAATDNQPDDTAASPARLIDPHGPQMKKLHATLNDMGMGERDVALTFISKTIGRDIDSSKKLTVAEASTIIETLTEPSFAEATGSANGATS